MQSQPLQKVNRDKAPGHIRQERGNNPTRQPFIIFKGNVNAPAGIMAWGINTTGARHTHTRTHIHAPAGIIAWGINTTGTRHKHTHAPAGIIAWGIDTTGARRVCWARKACLTV